MRERLLWAYEGKQSKEPPRPGAGSLLTDELVGTLAVGLQIPDDLGNRRDQLTHDFIDVLRRQLPLAQILKPSERGLEW